MKVNKSQLLSALSPTSTFIEKALKVHGNRYNYLHTEYINARKKVFIICAEHGRFSQAPTDHLAGKGCKGCGRKKVSADMVERQKSLRVSVTSFIERAEAVHGKFYGYEKVKFTHTKDKVVIVCPVHGEFTKEVTKHLIGGGCVKCSTPTLRNGWSFSEWEKQGKKSKYFEGYTLYVVALENHNEKFYKVGKTFRDVYKRFRNTPYNVTICLTLQGSAKDVSEKERKLHKASKNNKYVPLQYFDGKEECYSEIPDIIGTLNES